MKSGDSELSILRENEHLNEICSNTPNPRIVRGLELLSRPGNRYQPVGTDNPYISIPNNQPLLLNPKNKEQYQTYTNNGVHKYISLPLRMLFEAVAEKKSSNRELFFITVNLSKKTSNALVKNVKAAPAVYMDRIRGQLRDAGNLWDFFFVLEPSDDGSLHAHYIAALTPEEKTQFKSILEKDASSANNAIRFQSTYKRYHPARPGTPEWELLELDDEYGLSSYPEKGTDRNGRLRRYSEVPVDVGSADYIAKDFNKRLEGFGEQHWSAPMHIKKRASELYEEAYGLQRADQVKIKG